MKEWQKFIVVAVVFVGCWFLPIQNEIFLNAIKESLTLVRWYAREHVLLCLVPAFFIAGAISVFLSQGSVIKYLGPKAKKVVAYSVASVSGTVLAVCSCTVLPLFASIHKRGAGLGPAVAFLYAGPAINVLAIILTARVLGVQLGIARAVGAVVFSIVIGLLMAFIFRKDESDNEGLFSGEEEGSEGRTSWQNLIYFLSMIGILVFANWGAPQGGSEGLWALIYKSKWYVSAFFSAILIIALAMWFKKDELSEWVESSWVFSKQILPLLLIGVLIAGFLLGGPGSASHGVIPNEWISSWVGGNSIRANVLASVVGAFMYFATLTEVPILEGLLRSGMGQGPALALLLAGPALSLPNMLVIRSVMGTKKTSVFILLVVVLSALAGMIYGAMF